MTEEKTEEKPVTEEQLKTMLSGLVDSLKAVMEPVQEQLKRLETLLPNDVFILDHKKYIQIYKPELLKDEKLMSALDLFEIMGAKNWRKRIMRKRTHTSYTVFFESKEMSTLKDIVQEYVVDYSQNNFEINIGKALIHEWEYYYGERKVRFSAKEMGIVIRATLQAIVESAPTQKVQGKEYQNDYYDEEHFREILLFAKGFFEKNVEVNRQSYWGTMNEDGTEKSEKEIVNETKKFSDIFGELMKSKEKE